MCAGVVRYSIWVIAQQNPASSRAAATAMIVRRLGALRAVAQVRCSRRCALPGDRDRFGGLAAWRSLQRLADPRGACGSRYDVGEVPLRVLLRRRPPEPGVTISDHRALQRLFRD